MHVSKQVCKQVTAVMWMGMWDACASQTKLIYLSGICKLELSNNVVHQQLGVSAPGLGLPLSPGGG